jgi:MFS family permease
MIQLIFIIVLAIVLAPVLAPFILGALGAFALLLLNTIEQAWNWPYLWWFVGACVLIGLIIGLGPKPKPPAQEEPAAAEQVVAKESDLGSKIIAGFVIYLILAAIVFAVVVAVI